MGQLPAGREAAALGECAARGNCGFPVDIAMRFPLPDKIYSLGGAGEISMAVTGSCLPSGSAAHRTSEK